MASSIKLTATLLPGARELLAAHGRELPQRDDLCGAFCGALALRAAGIEGHEGQPPDQDAVAAAAGSLISTLQDAGVGCLPPGEHGRRDYRLALPFIDDPGVSGTTADGLIRAVEQLSAGALAAIPFSGPWTPTTLRGVFDVAAALERPATLIANLATGHLWGANARPHQLLDYLLAGAQAGPPPDWEVGHFVCVIGRVEGPGGNLYGLADTYPSLGSGGVHLQPEERLAAAVERREMPAGGVMVIAFADDAAAIRAGAAAVELVEGAWDNGTASPEALR
jgi:hypothetical protein